MDSNNLEILITRFLTFQNRRERKQEDELWKGIDQSLYLGPSGSVVWANVLVGRILFSCLNDNQLLGHIQEFLQKKLSAIKVKQSQFIRYTSTHPHLCGKFQYYQLPSFMEEVIIAQVNLGDTPPLVHRVSQPLIDERGTWIDADVTYEGLMHMTITTKLNLLRLKRQHTTTHHSTTTMTSTPTSTPTSNTAAAGGSAADSNGIQTPTPSNVLGNEKTNDAIYDSNAESSGASSSESESFAQNNADVTE